MSERASVFVTGAAGFVGRHVLARLAQVGCPVFALTRREPGSAPEGVTWLQGELADVARHADALARSHRVLHLAARTGKASPEELERDNVEGTRSLVEAARDAGVPGFLHVSTIAAGYPEKRAYPYAATKERSEEVVRSSGLAHVVARPTIVLGSAAPAWATIRGLARLPVVPLFGGGRARVQPIDVDDLARLLVELALETELDGSTVELGGPEVLTFRELLARTYRHVVPGAPGKVREPRFLPVPLGATISTLAVLERFLRPLLPASAGQFYAFRYDSTAAPHPFLDVAREPLLDVEQMLRRYAA